MSTSPTINATEAAALPVPGSPVWKQEISARVQAHRNRRQSAQASLAGLDAAPDSGRRRINSRTASVVASVTERYSAATSYSDYLATLSAPPAAPETSQDFQTHGSSALDYFPDSYEHPEPPADPEPRIHFHESIQPEATEPEAIEPESIEPEAAAPEPLDDFLQQAIVEPDTPIATKLIEFPRQLIAARRARPRLAEGPLRSAKAEPQPATASDLPTEDATPQLRIFEVEDSQISREPLAATAAAESAPEWHYIQLDTPLLTSPVAAHSPAEPQPASLPVASVERRLLAAALDLGLITLGFFLFTAAFIAVAATPPSDAFAMTAAAAVFATMAVAYQWIFLTLSDATPGMRYARIALCTFQDDNPSVRLRRSRVLATMLTAAAAGLGFLWIWFDDDHLGWHDRISRTYQRCY